MKTTFLFFLFILLSLSWLGCQRRPKASINEAASIQAEDELPENPLLLVSLNTSIQPKQHTLSALYGNAKAAEYAQTHSDGLYPEGAVLYEFTWKQEADSLWFGANIPGKLLQVERITFSANQTPNYQLYIGQPLKTMQIDSLRAQQRTSWICSQQMAVSP